MIKEKICERCVMDTSDKCIEFNENGICNYCTEATELLQGKTYSESSIRDAKYNELIETIRESGKGNKYDCLAGISGGVDSTYVIYKLVQSGLRVLAVHLDNGFNSEQAENNIAECVNRLGIDLIRITADKDEFGKAISAYIKAGVSNCEAVTDSAMLKLLYDTAKRNSIKYIVTGHNVTSESIGAKDWGYPCIDKKNIKSILLKNGNLKLKKIELISIYDLIYYRLSKSVQKIELLDYLNYDKEKAKQLLIDELGWKDYGSKHGESVWTRFFQNYYLPKRFGYDKRRWHFSSLICAGQMTRDEALEELNKNLYEDENLLKNDLEKVCELIDMTESELMEFMKQPIHNAKEYSNDYWIIKSINQHNMNRAKKTNKK